MLKINKSQNDIKEPNIIINIKNDFPNPYIINNHNSNNIENNELNDSKLFISHPIINNPIVSQLIEFGFEKKSSQRMTQYFHPRDIEEALDYFSIINGIIQHHFIQDRDKNNLDCYICGRKKEIHIGFNKIYNINNGDDDINELDFKIIQFGKNNNNSEN